MLKLYLGEDRIANSERIFRQIREKAEQGIGGQILIVPEQYSHAAERALCKIGGDTISRYAEVLSFSRLADRVFSVCGGVSLQYLDGGGRFLTVCRAAEQVRSRLKVFAAVSTKTDFLLKLGTMTEELLADCITPQMLSDASKRAEGQFAQKLEELGILYESYLSVCKTGRGDPVTRLYRLAELLEQEPYAEDKILYFDGFSDFTAAERRIVEILLQTAPQVEIALRTDLSEKPIFRTTAQTAKWLLREAARLDVRAEKQTVPFCAARKPEIVQAMQTIFSAKHPEAPVQDPSVFLHRAFTTHDECDYAARMVCELTKTLRYRDVCIAVTDRDLYFADLRDLFARAKIPADFSGTEAILQCPLFVSLLAALRAADSMEYEDMLLYLKSDLCALRMDACDRVERYASFWQIRGKQWQTPWTMHPNGYGAKWNDEDSVLLAQLEQWRKLAVAPIVNLKNAFHAAQNVTQQLRAVSDFMDEAALEQTLRAACERQSGTMQAQKTQQLYEILLTAMEQMHGILGNCVMSTDRFVQTFTMLLGQYRVGTIPACVDEVQIGTTEDFRYQRAKALIVLGAEEGKLPAFRADSGILTDDERRKLLSMGLSLAPAQTDRFEREMGDVHAALSLPTECLALCTSGDEPSYLFLRLQKLFSDVHCTSSQELPFAPDAYTMAASVLRSGNTCEADLPTDVQAAVHTLREKREYDFSPLNRQTVQGLYGTQIALSASRIDKLAGCRFAHFLNYGLKAKPWEKAEFDASHYGTFVHHVLECTVREVMANGGFAETDEQTLLEIAKHHADRYAREQMPELFERGARSVYLYERNLRETLDVVADVGRELRLSKFTPADVELNFSNEGKSLPSVTVEGKLGSGCITGSVDRVDLFEDHGRLYCRVIDYKTGKKSFVYGDVLQGEGLQMLIYLFAIRRYGKQRYGKQPIPAGVLYVLASSKIEHLKKAGDLKELQKITADQRKRKGLILADERIIDAMEQQEAPEYLPCKRTKDGELTGDLADHRQFEALERFVEAKLADLTDDIFSGSVTPNPAIHGPKDSACSYCEFSSVCHEDAMRHENRYFSSVKAEEFWKKVEGRSKNE